QAIRLHGVEIEDRVEERLALLQARGLGLQVHGVCAEPRGSGPKTYARARRGFEEGQRHGLAAQRRQLFQGVLLNFLKRLALVEEKAQFVRSKRFESQQIAEAVSQCPFFGAQAIKNRNLADAIDQDD